jgi:hypothetical protein
MACFDGVFDLVWKRFEVLECDQPKADPAGQWEVGTGHWAPSTSQGVREGVRVILVGVPRKAIGRFEPQAPPSLLHTQTWRRRRTRTPGMSFM